MISGHESSRSQENPRPPALRKRRRWLPRWPWLLSLGLLGCGFFLWSLDELPPDISDLPFEPVVLKDEENGYVLLKRAALAVSLAIPSMNERGSSDWFFISQILAGAETRDQARITRWISALEPFWPMYKKAAEATASQSSRLDKPSADQDEIALIVHLMELAALRAKYDVQQNRLEDAADLAISTLRIFSTLRKSRVDLNRYLISNDAKKLAFAAFAEIARHPQTPLPLLRKILTEMESARDDGTGLHYAMRSEIQTFLNAQSLVEKSGMRSFNKTIARSDTLWDDLPIPGLYKPNKTLRIYAQVLREALAVNATSLGAINAFARSSVFSKTHTPDWSWLTPENQQGRVLLLTAAPYWPSLMKGQMEDQSRNSAYQAMIALHLYKREHGEFPATLDALVPEYLPAVPMDYFDRAPIRYSQALGVVWSVGPQSLTITSENQYTDDDVAVWLVPQIPSHFGDETTKP